VGAGGAPSAAEPPATERPLTPSDIPGIPMRKGLLPCCAFGAKLGASVGPAPVPFYSRSNRAPPRAVSLRPRGGGGARATGPDGVHAGAWRDPAAPLHDG